MGGEGVGAISSDRVEYGIGALGPDERLWVVIMGVDEGGDVGLEFIDAAMDAALDLLVGEQREPALDLVQPGGTGHIRVLARGRARADLSEQEHRRFVENFIETQKIYRENSPAAAQQMVDLALNAEDERVRGTMASLIIERAWGKPREYDPTAETANAKPKFDPRQYTTEELEQLYAVSIMMARRQGLLPPEDGEGEK
jgi:hypothetical protein